MAARTGAAAADRVASMLDRSDIPTTTTRRRLDDGIPGFEGVLPALITPFTDDGAAVDAGALRALIDRCIDAGVGGLVPNGSTGEFTALTSDERRAVVELTIDAAAGRVPTVAATGALTTAETVELSVHAERAGAAA